MLAVAAADLAVVAVSVVLAAGGIGGGGGMGGGGGGMGMGGTGGMGMGGMGMGGMGMGGMASAAWAWADGWRRWHGSGRHRERASRDWSMPGPAPALGDLTAEQIQELEKARGVATSDEGREAVDELLRRHRARIYVTAVRRNNQ